MVTLHEAITFLVSMQISISSLQTHNVNRCGRSTLLLHDALPIFFCVSKHVSVSCAYTQAKRAQFSSFNRTLDAINNVFRTFSAFHAETGRLDVGWVNIISNDATSVLNSSRKARKSDKVQRTIMECV